MKRPGLDQRPLPRPFQFAMVCPVCGGAGPVRLGVFQMPGGHFQVHAVHAFVACSKCSAEHPSKICTVPTWPETPGMHRPVLYEPHPDR
jgi:hypothetical protein